METQIAGLTNVRQNSGKKKIQKSMAKNAISIWWSKTK